MTVGFLVVLPLSIYLPWSSAVYPTQAKKRLEWGTQPLLLVQGVGVKAALDFPMYTDNKSRGQA